MFSSSHEMKAKRQQGVNEELDMANVASLIVAFLCGSVFMELNLWSWRYLLQELQDRRLSRPTVPGRLKKALLLKSIAILILLVSLVKLSPLGWFIGGIATHVILVIPIREGMKCLRGMD